MIPHPKTVLQIIKSLPKIRTKTVPVNTTHERIACMLCWCGLAQGMGAANPDFGFFLGEPPAGHEWDLDRPFRIVDGQTQGVSTCGLFAERLLELAGFAVPWAGQPYGVGTAISRMVAFASKHNAWALGRAGLVGEVTVIGPTDKEHVIVPTEHMTEFNDNGCSVSVEVRSVEGGQVGEDELQLIDCASRSLRRGFVDYLGDRPVLGCVQVAHLPVVPTATFPDRHVLEEGVRRTSQVAP